MLRSLNTIIRMIREMQKCQRFIWQQKDQMMKLVQIDEFLANGGFEGVKKDPEIEEKKAEDTNMALKFL